MLTLIIGNKNYSSWSLRAWLGLKFSGLNFDEVLIPLDTESFADDIARYSDAARVPVLVRDGQSIWDSLAILETVAEMAPDAGLWPQDAAARAHARAISAEMHSGFAALRDELPMNMRRTVDNFTPSAAAQRDIDRICEIWRGCQEVQPDRWLFGARPTIADAMFAPVASRFRTYGIELDEGAAEYVDDVLSLASIREWCADAQNEPWVHPDVELVGQS